MDAQPPQWYQELAVPMVSAVVRRYLPLFKSYPDLDAADLRQEGLKRALLAYSAFDNSKAKASTFIYTAAERQIIDILSSRSSESRRVKKIVAEEIRSDAAEDPEPVLEGEEIVHIAEHVYQTAMREMERFVVSGPGRPHRWTVAQRAALMAIKDRLHASQRGMVRILRSRPDLCRAIGLTKHPDVNLFARMGKSASKLKKRLKAAEGVCAAMDGANRDRIGASAAGAACRTPQSTTRVVVDVVDRARRTIMGHTGIAKNGESMSEATGVEEEIPAAAAARVLRVSTHTLRDWRSRKLNLRYIRYGRSKIFYFAREVEEFNKRRREVVDVAPPGQVDRRKRRAN